MHDRATLPDRAADPAAEATEVPPATAATDVSIGLLGPLEVRVGPAAVAVSGGLLRNLLLRLVIAAPGAVSTTALTRALWGDEAPDEPVNALQSLVSRLRRALGAAGPGAVAAGPAGYRLTLPEPVVDADRFRVLAARGRAELRGDRPAAAAATLRDALALWRGEALADAGDADWAVAARRTLAAGRLDAALDRVDADAALGRGADLAAELTALAVEHPLDERVALRLVDALTADGRGAAALGAYERFRARLADTLGTDPSPALRARHLALLRGSGPVPSEPRDPDRPVVPDRGPPGASVPLPITTFVGRTADLRAVRELLAAGRLVSIVGAGGCGKTRLATEVAAALGTPGPANGGEGPPGVHRDRSDTGGDRDRRPDVRLVQLAPVTASDDVPAVVLSAVGGYERSSERLARTRPAEPTDRVLEALADRDTLLLLDNCEHLLGAVAELTERILSACPRVRVLTTSREPLALTGEALWPLSPLGFPPLPARTAAGARAGAVDAAEVGGYDAVRLFCDRASAARPSFVLDATTAADVAEVVRRLDGLPLAIELAAARLRTLPLPRLAAGLTDRFRLLTGGSRTALPRHRTLRAVIEWSWDLLTDVERDVAESVSVFSGGVTAAAAHAVGPAAGSEDDTADVLASLVDKSLLTVSGGAAARYGMLETLREFGVDRLVDRGRLAAAHEAHARFFAALADRAEPELWTAGQLPWLRALVAERENLSVAIRRLAAAGDVAAAVATTARLSWFWLLADWHTDAHAAMSVAIEAAAAAPDATLPETGRVELLCLQGIDVITAAVLGVPGAPADEAEMTDRLRVVISELDARIPDDRLLPEPGRRFVVLLRPVLELFTKGDGLRTALARALADPVAWVAGVGHVMAGNAGENEGDIAALDRHAHAALEILRPVGERWALSAALAMVAQAAVNAGDLPAAAAAYTESLRYNGELAAEIGTSVDDVFGRLQLARVLQWLGDLEGALAQAGLAIASGGDTGGGPGTRGILADAMLLQILRSAGRTDEVREVRARITTRLLTREARRGPFDGHETALALSVGASIDIADGLLDAAAAALVGALDAAVATADQPVVASVGATVGRLAHARGDAVLAARILGAGASLRGTPVGLDLDLVDLVATLRAELGTSRFAELTVFTGTRAEAVALLRAAIHPDRA